LDGLVRFVILFEKQVGRLLMSNTKTSVLIVGVGSIGARHVECFDRAGDVQVSICEVDACQRQRVQKEFAIERAFADLEAALAEPHDAIVVATPAQCHIAVAQQAAESGLHLLIEKPLSVSTEGVQQLVETVARQGLIAAVAYVYRAHPALAAMKAAIDTGRFGRPLQLVAVSGQEFAKFRPAYRDTYFRDRATGGGAIQDALTHLLNAGEWLLGPIDRLVADADHMNLRGVLVEDTVHLLARHDEAMATYALNQHQSPNETTITVACEHATVRFDYHQRHFAWMPRGEDVWKGESGAAWERNEHFIAQAKSFLQAIEHGSPTLCPLQEGAQTLQANLAALASADGGGWQAVRSQDA